VEINVEDYKQVAARLSKDSVFSPEEFEKVILMGITDEKLIAAMAEKCERHNVMMYAVAEAVARARDISTEELLTAARLMNEYVRDAI